MLLSELTEWGGGREGQAEMDSRGNEGRQHELGYAHEGNTQDGKAKVRGTGCVWLPARPPRGGHSGDET